MILLAIALVVALFVAVQFRNEPGDCRCGWPKAKHPGGVCPQDKADD